MGIHPVPAVEPKSAVKSVQFSPDELQALDELRFAKRHPSFSEAVRAAVKRGLVAIRQDDEDRPAA